MSERREGNPNTRFTDNEAARMGRARTPDDIPKQATKRNPGNVSYYNPTGTYKMGPAQRPGNIKHDNGFLRLGRRGATTEDYVKLAKWKAILEGAEALRPDLTDALGAYRHFLEGNGKPRNFSYERYVMNDESGRTTLRNAILDIQKSVIKLWQDNGKPKSFTLTGSSISCGSSSNFPYPATENWQKAIGGHLIWLSGTVTVEGGTHTPPVFKMVMTLHGEDRYNFNPGDADIVTGIPDSDNGIFEITGLAHQFDHFSKLTRVIVWKGTKLGVISSGSQSYGRQRQPQDNRRIRNRI